MTQKGATSWRGGGRRRTGMGQGVAGRPVAWFCSCNFKHKGVLGPCPLAAGSAPRTNHGLLLGWKETLELPQPSTTHSCIRVTKGQQRRPCSTLRRRSRLSLPVWWGKKLQRLRVWRGTDALCVEFYRFCVVFPLSVRSDRCLGPGSCYLSDRED